MKKSVAVSLLAVALLLVATVPSYAWRGHPGVRGDVFVGVGPGPFWWWGAPYPYWYYPPPYYYPPPPVVVQEPQVYVQSPPAGYWYYCASAQAYYPSVQTCQEAWIKVPQGPQWGKSGTHEVE